MAMNPAVQPATGERPAFLWGTLLIIASQPLRLMLSGTDTWLRFATALVGVVK